MKWVEFCGCYASNIGVDNSKWSASWQYKLEMFFFGHCNVDVVIMRTVSHVVDL